MSSGGSENHYFGGIEPHGREKVREEMGKDSLPFARLQTLPLSALVRVPANVHGSWPCTVCCSRGSLGLAGWPVTSEHGRAWPGLGQIQIRREEGRSVSGRR